MIILSTDYISTRLGDRLCSSYMVLAIGPKISRIMSLGVKLYIGYCLEISLLLPGVEKIGLFANGQHTSVKKPSSKIILLSALLKVSFSLAPGGIFISMKPSLSVTDFAK